MRITVPDRYRHRQRFYVPEVAAWMAEECGCSVTAARSRIYRALAAGAASSFLVTGRVMIPVDEVLKLLNGVPYESSLSL